MEDQVTNKRTTRFTRNKTEDISNMLYGKIPPQARELEEAVLGAILIEREALTSVANILSPENFYVDAHATIYKTMCILKDKSTPVDLLTITEELRKNAKLEEVGGAFYLSELTNKIASSDNIEFHARIIIQKFIQRDLIRISNDIIRDSYEDTTDVFDLLDNVEIQISKINSSINGSSIDTALSIVNQIKKDILSPPDEPLYVPTTLNINYNYGTVNAIGAKPATGKTAFMIQSALETAKKNINVGILSLELKKRLLVPKMIHCYKGTFASKIIENRLSEEETEAIISEDFDVFNLIHLDEKRTTNQNIRSKIITMVIKNKVKIIWIDYIQLVFLIKDKNTTDVKAMEDLMNLLQDTAKELDIAIVVLSQMKRGWEKPTIEELRGGGIEAACSKVYLLFDEFAKENDGKKFMEIDSSIRGKLILIDGKSRFDDTDSRNLFYHKLAQVMHDWNDRPSEQFVPSARYVPSEHSYEMEEIPAPPKKDINNQESFDIF